MIAPTMARSGCTISVLITIAAAEAMNSAGESGYPGTRNGDARPVPAAWRDSPIGTATFDRAR
jgi:hypothetical protein